MTVSLRNCTIHEQNVWPECLACDTPTDSRRRLSRLRDHTIARARGLCEWPTCSASGDEMAHLEHRGMGGSPSADHPNNVAWLCRGHHDILDGRTGVLKLRWELNELLRATIHGVLS